MVKQLSRYQISFITEIRRGLGTKYLDTMIEAMREIKIYLKKYPQSVGFLSKKVRVDQHGFTIYKKIGAYSMEYNPETGKWKFINIGKKFLKKGGYPKKVWKFIKDK